MEVKKGYIYKNEKGVFYTPAMSGDFIIVDAWECNEKGRVLDIKKKPYPTPINTNDLIEVAKNKYSYRFPYENSIYFNK